LNFAINASIIAICRLFSVLFLYYQKKQIPMKTLFNQHQTMSPFLCCNKSVEKYSEADLQREQVITEHIKAINRESQQPQTEELTDLMNYYLSVAG
jgi:hypothetical protein